jgi:hypothetical protein
MVLNLKRSPFVRVHATGPTLVTFATLESIRHSSVHDGYENPRPLKWAYIWIPRNEIKMRICFRKMGGCGYNNYN